MINRTTQSLLGAVGVLVLALGIAEVHPPKGQAAASGDSVRTDVSQSTLLCPPPLQGTSGSTVYSLAVPGPTGSGSGSGGSGGGASLAPLSAPIIGSALAGSSSTSSAKASPSATASGKSGGTGSTSGSKGSTASPKAGSSAAPAPSATGAPSIAAAPPIAQLTQIGGATTAKAGPGANAPGMIAVGSGSTAPGLTVQQTTASGHGLSGTGCTAAGTGFWFIGAQVGKDSTEYVELSNPGQVDADADIQILGPNGEVDTTAASNITVPARGTSSLLLSTLVQPGNEDQPLAVQVLVRSGQLAAGLQATTGDGVDWLPSTSPSGTVNIPGLPGDVHQYALAVAAPGDADADLKVQLASQSGWITPAGHETIHVKAGMVAFTNLADVTHGQPGMIRLSPTDPKQATPVVAGIAAVSKSAGDVAYLSGAQPITGRGTVAGNTGGDATLLLTAPNGAATVTVGTLGSGGTPTTKSVQVPAGSTVAVPLAAPGGAGSTFAVTVTPTSGGPVFAARELTRKGVGLTIQQIADDGSTVLVPTAIQNPAILVQ